MATTLTIGATSQIAKVKFGSLSVKFNTADMVLEDPSVVPALGDAVTMTNPTWAGTVTSVGKSDTVDRATGHFEVKITATNTDTAGASAAPFNLSDAPNGTTTFGYRRLQVTNTQNTDGTTTAHGSCVINQTGLWPAMTFTLTSANLGYSGTNFSVQSVTVTWPGNAQTPEYMVEFGDPLVTMSVWANSSQAGVLPITTTKITDGAVTTPKVAAGSITADKLEAQLVLATEIVTPALTGARLELDADGFRSYDSGNNQRVNIPTTDDPVTVTGEIDASSLVSTATAEMRGTVLLTGGSVTTVAGQVQAPANPPTLTEAQVKDMLLDLTGEVFPVFGADYDTSDGTVYGIALNSGGTDSYLNQWNNPGGAQVHKVLTGDHHVDVGTDVAVAGSSVFVWYGQEGILRKYVKSTLALSASSAVLGFNSATAGIFYDPSAAKIVLVDTSATGSGQIRFRLIDTSTLTVSSTVTATGFTVTGTTTRLKGGYDDGTLYWIAYTPDGVTWDARAFNSSTGAYQANRDFGIIGTTKTRIHSGLMWDGSAFVGLDSQKMYWFSSWDWTTASAIYWVGYSWYDSVATVHETPTGPLASLTMHRRTSLYVANASIPTGGSDDPDSVRVYMLPNASSPSAGSLKRQVSDSLGSRQLTTYASGGAADPTTNNFPAATAAILKSSASPGWNFQGDGTFSLPTDKYTESTTFTINSGGTATFGSKVARWLRIGNLVVWRLTFTVTANGSGAGTVTVTNPGWPSPAGTNDIVIPGLRSVVGGAQIGATLDVAGVGLVAIRPLSTNALVTGADLANTAVYDFNGAYYSD